MALFPVLLHGPCCKAGQGEVPQPRIASLKSNRLPPAIRRRLESQALRMGWHSHADVSSVPSDHSGYLVHGRAPPDRCWPRNPTGNSKAPTGSRTKSDAPLADNRAAGRLGEKFRQRPTLPHGNRAVPSALEGLTAVFGMGTGGAPPM